MAIEIVDLPIKNGDFLQLCKRLPEGTLEESQRRTGWWFQTFGLLSISYMGCHPSH